jgi:FMN reductase [NAD(P)H]
MNETLKVMHSHRSIRSYKSEPINEEILGQIVDAARLGPTSINGQQVSLVVVRDANKRAKIAEIAGGQAWIAQAPVFIVVVIDFYKTHKAAELSGQSQVIQESAEGLIVGSVDAGIALGNLMTASHALGLGVVPIGGIRRDPQAMIDLLGLPQYTFPVAGVCIGHVDVDSEQKPRLPIASFRHDEVYHAEQIEPSIKAYDQTLLDHWKKIARGEGQAWSSNISGFYRAVYFPKVRPVLEKQGFRNDK